MMLEPSDIHAAVNRLLIGLGQILTAAVLLACVMLLAELRGDRPAATFAVLALAFTCLGYALQLVTVRATKWAEMRMVVLAVIWLSWAFGLIAVSRLVIGEMI